uniref:Uncharacterized protein n=1 Tax=Arundo donax TaxID=35708 RepID=A0A0A9BP02_ARUDO
MSTVFLLHINMSECGEWPLFYLISSCISIGIWLHGSFS